MGVIKRRLLRLLVKLLEGLGNTTVEGGVVYLKGGTFVPYSPPFPYLKEVWLPVIRNFGFKGKIKLERAGFYPKGGGLIWSQVEGIREFALPEIDLGFQPKRIGLLSLITEDLPKSIVGRQAQAALKVLLEKGYIAEVIKEVVKSDSPGTLLFLWAQDGIKRAGFSTLGKRGFQLKK